MKNTAYQFVDEDRLRDDILSTAEFGELDDVDGHGRTVLAGTEPNKRTREYFVDRLQDAGLSVQIDEVGNIVGRWVPEKVDPETSAVATGSHLDSVTAGGIFDGVLGVYAGLEAVRALQTADVELSRPIEIVSFTEEEGGRFSDGVLGSSVATGQQSVEEALALEDTNGISCCKALAEIGFRGEGRVDAEKWHSWLELHVEQSTTLENANVPIGIVTDITGTIRCHVDIIGEANHAGTTSMVERTDALPAASELVLEVESTANEIANTESKTAVATAGRVDVSPNSINVVPGEVHIGIDIRDIKYTSMETVVSSIRQCLDRLEQERQVETRFDRPYDIQPVSLSTECLTAVREAASSVGADTITMHSGAGHDTMHIAKVTDSGLIFAPSHNGYSHSPKEWTEWEDCTTATRVLTEGLYNLAKS